MRRGAKASFVGVSLCLVLHSSPGCISIPKTPYVLSRHERGGPVASAAPCPAGGPGGLALPDDSRGEGVDPRAFTLLSWNTGKGGRTGWREDLARLASGADLLALQEARLTGDLLGLLEEGRYRWDLTAAFLGGGRETGVLTGSRSPPGFVCASGHPEPLVAVPKTFLVSLYSLKGEDTSLLVANVHLINFTLGTKDYLEQLRGLEEILGDHRGPLVVTGDFNTWSGRREGAVRSLAERLRLREVAFPAGSRTTFFGRVVDHVFYRGIEPVEARAVPVVSSDHNPLVVTFRATPAGGY